MTDQSISDSLIASTLELKEGSHILFEDMLMILVIYFRERFSWNDSQITFHTIRYVGHLYAWKRAKSLFFKIDYNRFLASKDIIMFLYALYVPKMIFHNCTLVGFLLIDFKIGGYNGIRHEKHPDTIYLVSLMDKLSNLIKVATFVLDTREHRARLRTFKKLLHPFEMTLYLRLWQSVAFLRVNKHREEEVNRHCVLIATISPSVYSLSVTRIKTTEVHLVDVTYILDVLDHHFSQSLLGHLVTVKYIVIICLESLDFRQFFFDNFLDRVIHSIINLCRSEIIEVFSCSNHTSYRF